MFLSCSIPLPCKLSVCVYAINKINTYVLTGIELNGSSSSNYYNNEYSMWYTSTCTACSTNLHTDQKWQVQFSDSLPLSDKKSTRICPSFHHRVPPNGENVHQPPRAYS